MQEQHYFLHLAAAKNGNFEIPQQKHHMKGILKERNEGKQKRGD